LEQVEHAIKQAIGLGVISFDAIKLLILSGIERRMPKLDLDTYPYLPRARVDMTDARAYLQLLGRQLPPQSAPVGGVA
jgi:hypothetical protein